MLGSWKRSTLDAGCAAGPAFAARRHFISIGNWKHAPNLDAAAWACAEIWPRIQQTLAAAPAPAAAPPSSGSNPQGYRAASGSEAAASSACAARASSTRTAAVQGCGAGAGAGGGGAALAGRGEAGHGGTPPEFHLYGAYESHAARALHAPESGVYVRGHAPSLEARRPSTAAQ